MKEKCYPKEGSFYILAKYHPFQLEVSTGMTQSCAEITVDFTLDVLRTIAHSDLDRKSVPLLSHRRSHQLEKSKGKLQVSKLKLQH